MKPVRLQVMLVAALVATVGAQGQVPGIIRAPQGTSVLLGSSINLSVQGSGATPLSYQWLLNAKAIASATAQSYSLSNIQKTNGGDYQVVLSNSFGSITSVVARVNVVSADIPGITNALVAHLPFEGSYNDISGNGNSGAGMGLPGYTETGKCGGAGLHFLTKRDGSEIDFVTLDTPDDFSFGTNTDFSVSFWVRYTTPSGEFPILANKDWSGPNNQGWGIAAGADGRMRWTLVGPPGTAKGYDGIPGTLTNGIWHHIAITFQRTGMLRPTWMARLLMSNRWQAALATSPLRTVWPSTSARMELALILEEAQLESMRVWMTLAFGAVRLLVMK